MPVLDLDPEDFIPMWVGVERPPATDHDRFGAYGLRGFREPPEEVLATAERAPDAVEEVVQGQPEGARR